MSYTLPSTTDDDLFTDIGREWGRKICTPLSEARVGDVVGVVLSYLHDSHGVLHQLPTGDLVTFDPDPLTGKSYRRMPLRYFPIDQQQYLAWQVKMMELAQPARTDRLFDHARPLLEYGGDDNYALVLTAHAGLLFHEWYIDWIGRAGAIYGCDDGLDLPQEAADKCLHAILPSGLSAHEIIELTPEFRRLCELAQNMVTLYDKEEEHIPFTLPDLSSLTEPA